MSTNIPIQDAVKTGNIAELNHLLSEGASVESRDDAGKTLLMLASEAGHEAVARHLLKWRAAVNGETERGHTALFFATKEGNAPVVRLLLTHGAKTEIVLSPEPDRTTPEERAKQREEMEAKMANFKRLFPTTSNEDDEREMQLLLEQVDQEPKPKPRTVNLLMSAIKSGNVETLEALLDAGLDPDQPLGGMLRPLSFAINFQDEEMVRTLLKAGTKVEPLDAESIPPLTEAVMKENKPIVRLLLEAGADPSSSGEIGMSPLTFAVYKQNTEMVDLLMEFGAKPDMLAGVMARNADDEDGGAVHQHLRVKQGVDWHEAVKAGNIATVRARLEAGATVDAPNEKGETGLYIAAHEGHAEIAQLLLERGANFDAIGEVGFTVLLQAVIGGNSDIVKALLAHGADIRQQNEWGWSPLWLAALSGKNEIADLLLRAGAAIGIVEDALLGERDRVRERLRSGTPVDYAHETGMTALMAAAAKGDLELIEELVERVAHIEARDRSGDTPLHHAIKRGQQDAAALLLDKGADINAWDNQQKSALYHAVMGQTEPLVRLLLERGADVNAKDKFFQGIVHSLVWLYGEYKREEEPVMLRVLLEHGADANLANNEGATPLLTAIEKNAPRHVVGLLLKYGADTGRENPNGETPLHKAAAGGNLELTRLLLDSGVEPNAGNSGESAYEVALFCGHDAVAELLKERGGKPDDRWKETDMAEDTVKRHKRTSGGTSLMSAFAAPYFQRKWDVARGRTEGVADPLSTKKDDVETDTP